MLKNKLGANYRIKGRSRYFHKREQHAEKCRKRVCEHVDTDTEVHARDRDQVGHGQGPHQRHKRGMGQQDG